MQDYDYFCRCIHFLSPMSLDEILKKLDAETKSRMARKVPSWFDDSSSVIPGSDRESLIFPSSLSTQQCSSEKTALYKARVASNALLASRSPQRACPPTDTGRGRGPLDTSSRQRTQETMGGAGESKANGVPLGAYCLPQGQIADLTGGLGVDSWAFSKCFEKVLYNEANAELAEAVKHNFKVLGCSNIEVSNRLLEPENLKDILGDFEPDVIFLDPARRSAAGKKVFLLEDCQPDVLKLKDELLAASPNLLLKLSPMADITMLLQRLGPAVRQLHVVAFDGECKELLVWVQRNWSGPAELIIHEDGVTLGPFDRTSSLTSEQGMPGECTRMAIGHNFCPEGVLPGQIIYEPGKALLKAGLFDYPCTLGYAKLAKHTHLYIAPDSFQETSFPTGSGISLPGKYFRIEKVLPLQSKTIKEIARQGISAEVSTHNVPIKAEDLRTRLHATPSATSHLFAVGCSDSNYLLIAQRVMRNQSSLSPTPNWSYCPGGSLV